MKFRIFVLVKMAKLLHASFAPLEKFVVKEGLHAYMNGLMRCVSIFMTCILSCVNRTGTFVR